MWQLAERGVGGVRLTRTDRDQGSGVLYACEPEVLSPCASPLVCKRLLRLDDVNVTAVEFSSTSVVVTVVLRRRRLVCPHCGFKTSARYDLG